MCEQRPAQATHSRPARIRALVTEATRQNRLERFWSLAVACQLIEEHLTDLRCRAVTHSAQARRRELCRQAWQARLRRVRARLSRHRPAPPPRQ